MKPRTAGTRWTLDPKNDFVFTALFGSEKNRKLLIALLNDVLQPATPIVSVELLPHRPEPTDIAEKLIVLDLRVRLESGEQIDVEMQTRRHAALRSRILLYWSRMFTGQARRNQPYSSLKRCVVILITDFVELAGPGYHSFFQVRERTTGELFDAQLELHVLELPKLRNLAQSGNEPPLAAWCRFFSAETDEQLESLAMQHPIIKEAKSALDEISADEIARIQAERREDELYFYEHGLHLSREEGREQGREEGREQGSLLQARSTLKRLLELKFGKSSPTVERRIDAATHPELDRWLDAVLTADSIDTVFR